MSQKACWRAQALQPVQGTRPGPLEAFGESPGVSRRCKPRTGEVRGVACFGKKSLLDYMRRSSNFSRVRLRSLNMLSAILEEMKSKDVLLPAALFAALSPGAILALPSTSINSLSTNPKSVFIHALVYLAAIWAGSKHLLDREAGEYELIVPVILFVILSPGLLLLLPPGKFGGSSSISMASIAVHTLVFAFAYAALRVHFPAKYAPGASIKQDVKDAMKAPADPSANAGAGDSAASGDQAASA